MSPYLPRHDTRENPSFPVIAAVAAAVVVTAGVGAVIYFRRTKGAPPTVGVGGSSYLPRPQPRAEMMLQMPAAQAAEAARRGQAWRDTQGAESHPPEQGDPDPGVPLAAVTPTRQYTLPYRGFEVKIAVQLDMSRGAMKVVAVRGVAPYPRATQPAFRGPGMSGAEFPPALGLPPVLTVRRAVTPSDAEAWYGLLEDPRVDAMAEEVAGIVQQSIDAYLGA